MKNKLLLKKIFVHGMFWFWNAVFVVVALTLIVPYITWPLINDAFNGAVPVSVAVYGLLIVLLPTICIALTVYFRKNMHAIFWLFCGFEIPVFFLILMRLMLLRDLNPGMIHLIANLFLALGAFLYFIWRPRSDSVVPIYRHLRLIMVAFVLLTGLYLGIILLAFSIPMTVLFLQELFSADTWSDIAEILMTPEALFISTLFLVTMGLFLAMPFLIVYMYVKVFVREVLSAIAVIGKPRVIGTVGVIVSINIALFVVLNQQSQQAVFQVLGQMEEAGLNVGLIEDKARTRNALVNAYLASWRYVSPRDKSNAVAANFKSAFGSSDSTAARFSQGVFNSLALPFLYDGEDFHSDRDRAADYYQKIFDTPLEKAERKKILAALNSTWEREQAAAGLMNAASEYVLVTEQRIDVEEIGSVGRVTVFHTLENQTFDEHEVTMHFSLPDEAVLTGVWLSDDPQQPKKYSYLVSPRGAAQQVYNNEVSRRIDPSLLEQVGLRQYRLRAFPVPARRYEESEFNGRDRMRVKNYKVDPLFLWLEYEVIRTSDGKWLLPRLLEKRNLYWTESTKRMLNGNPLKTMDDWMPNFVDAGESVRETLVAQVGDKLITAVPVDEGGILKANLNSSEKVAVIVDGSYSMHRKRDLVEDALAKVSKNPTTYQLFICHDLCKRVDSASVDTPISFYGNSNVLQQLEAWAAGANTGDYNSIFVLTDEGSYELESSVEVPAMLPNLWLVHLNDALPYAYHDQLLELLRRERSGIAGSLEDAVAQYMFQSHPGLDVVRSQLEEGQLLFAVSPGYYWLVSGGSGTEGGAITNGFTKIAAKNWHDYLAKTELGKVGQAGRIQVLDSLHAIARDHGIVTDYSSMIVLVNERQKEALKHAEGEDDRFEREVETGSENISTPAEVFSVTAVPEPEEWLLLGVVAILSVVAFRNRRRNAIRRFA